MQSVDDDFDTRQRITDVVEDIVRQEALNILQTSRRSRPRTGSPKADAHSYDATRPELGRLLPVWF